MTEPALLRWHQIVVVVSVLAPLSMIVLAAGNPIRSIAGTIFVLLVPGMALVGRSSFLLRRGLLTFETWATLIPISFAVFVAGSLACVYVYGWHPTATMFGIAALCALSSTSVLHQVEDGSSE